MKRPPSNSWRLPAPSIHPRIHSTFLFVVSASSVKSKGRDVRTKMCQILLLLFIRVIFPFIVMFTLVIPTLFSFLYSLTASLLTLCTQTTTLQCIHNHCSHPNTFPSVSLALFTESHFINNNLIHPQNGSLFIIVPPIKPLYTSSTGTSLIRHFNYCKPS